MVCLDLVGAFFKGFLKGPLRGEGIREKWSPDSIPSPRSYFIGKLMYAVWGTLLTKIYAPAGGRVLKQAECFRG